METVTLYRPNDLHSEFVSPSGAVWVEITSNDSENEPQCDICEKPIEVYDWLCLDGGEEVCADHVTIVPESIGRRLADEFNESMMAHNALVRMRCTVGEGMRKSLAVTHRPHHYLGWVCHPSQVDDLRHDFRVGHPRSA